MREFKIIGKNSVSLSAYHWELEDPKAVIVITHGMAEHAKRYDRFATRARENGYALVSMDLRGHGQSIAEGTIGHFADTDGVDIVIDDISRLIDCAADFYPNTPILFFGHSMGSIIGTRVVQLHGDRLAAAVLCGVTAESQAYATITPLLAGMFVKKTPEPCEFLGNMSFGSFNKAFAPNRTEYDWLSRDEQEVDKYVNDPLCGFTCSAQLFKDVAIMIRDGLKKKNILMIPTELPLFLISGAKDPVGHNGKDAAGNNDRYTSYGLNSKVKVYEDSRHELLNETNREEVTEDILNFYDEAVL